MDLQTFTAKIHKLSFHMLDIYIDSYKEIVLIAHFKGNKKLMKNAGEKLKALYIERFNRYAWN